MLSPISWKENTVRILRQTKLPDQEIWVDIESIEQLAEAIRILDVRGAPAIGVAAAFGIAMVAHKHATSDKQELITIAEQASKLLASTRPTAVNLFWALDRMEKKLNEVRDQDASMIRSALLKEAQAIQEQDIQACLDIGKYGAELLPEAGNVLTHCNAGALATGGYGTALGVIRSAIEQGKDIRVLANETRPLLQGARLTTWELQKDDIPVTLVCDNASGALMRQGKIQACVVGADRIAANGDVVNKIGTYTVAVCARRHGIPFYVAAPTSTIDISLSSGEEIPIEQRAGAEITHPRGVCIAPDGTQTINQAFDLTPATLISAIVTERGVAKHPDMPNQLLEFCRIET